MVHRLIFDTDSAIFNDDAAALAMLLQRSRLSPTAGLVKLKHLLTRPVGP